MLGLTEYRHGLGELIWKFNAPTWHFSQATYDQTAAAFNNPDYVSIIIGQYDPFTPPGNGASYRDHFIGKYDHRVFKVGHNLPQEAPQEFAQAVVDVDHF